MAGPVLLLASTSPRRSELLLRAGIAFLLAEPGPEPAGTGAPALVARQRAAGKAVSAILPSGSLLPVLGVDTVVDVDGVEFGKAADAAEAEGMLRRLVGRIHRVHTAHCLWHPATGAMVEELTSATVACRIPEEAELGAYLASGHWQGKAGAYGIQDPLAGFLQVVEGAFDTVVGLHVAAVRRLLAALAREP